MRGPAIPPQLISAVTADKTKSDSSLPLRLVANAIPTLLVLGVMAVGWLAVHEINTGSQGDQSEAGFNDEPVIADTLSLPSGKLNAGGFASVAATAAVASASAYGSGTDPL